MTHTEIVEDAISHAKAFIAGVLMRAGIPAEELESDPTFAKLVKAESSLDYLDGLEQAVIQKP